MPFIQVKASGIRPSLNQAKCTNGYAATSLEAIIVEVKNHDSRVIISLCVYDSRKKRMRGTCSDPSENTLGPWKRNASFLLF